MAHGGKRQGAGRKVATPEQREKLEQQKQERAEQKRQIMIDELLFPAICSAMHADEGYWKNGYLTIELSKTQIKQAYGAEALKEWCSYFTLHKIGGRDRYGIGYKSKWRFNINKYKIFLKYAKSLGHTVKDLPNPGFPPPAMLDRLDAIAQKAALRKTKE